MKSWFSSLAYYFYYIPLEQIFYAELNMSSFVEVDLTKKKVKPVKSRHSSIVTEIRRFTNKRYISMNIRWSFLWIIQDFPCFFMWPSHHMLQQQKIKEKCFYYASLELSYSFDIAKRIKTQQFLLRLSDRYISSYISKFDEGYHQKHNHANET